jgi:hypothetical protein
VDRLFRKDFLLFDSLKAGAYTDVSFGVEIRRQPAVHAYGIKSQVADLVPSRQAGEERRLSEAGHADRREPIASGAHPEALRQVGQLTSTLPRARTSREAISFALGRS